MQLPIHAEELGKVFSSLKSSDQGLTSKEAALRLMDVGPNSLPEPQQKGIFSIFFSQFLSPLIYVLFAAAFIILWLGETLDAYIIFAVLIFNAMIGAVQEGRAENTLAALRRMVETRATVEREGKVVIISDKEVVPGDIILLQEGEKIPADARIISSEGLQIDESSLTGESVPVQKFAGEVDPEAQLGERTNLLFKGTSVVSGRGRAVVIFTGQATEIGKISQAVADIDTDVPLKSHVQYLSELVIAVVLALSVLLFVVGYLSGSKARTMFSTVVSLSVSIIPEGLPIVMTVVLAAGVWRMAKRNVLVKKLQAVEALGQANVVAVDKTGTLTQNQMMVEKVYVGGNLYDISGRGYDPEGSVSLNGETIAAVNHPDLLMAGRAADRTAEVKMMFVEDEKEWKIAGDPTEAALEVFARKIGFREKEGGKIAEIPFSYSTKYHASLYGYQDKAILSVAGAPEVILSFCEKIWRKERSERLTPEERKEIEDKVLELSRAGFRVLASAIEIKRDSTLDASDLTSLSFVALYAIRDPLRPEVPEAMAAAAAAGIQVVMITGDHRITAQAIAREAGISDSEDSLLTGQELDSLDDEQLLRRLKDIKVFARVTPEHKLRLIRLFRKSGDIVAMTGDGVNDAPSLAAADLGVAMGKIGTEVAKESSDLILLNDDFGSIIAAVEEGRSIYSSIKKVVLYLFSANIGEVLVISGAIALGLPLPILPAQIIWLNFVTDTFLDISLGLEPHDRNILRKKFKRPSRFIVDLPMFARMLFLGSIIAIGTLFAFTSYLPFGIGKALTVSLTTLAVFQWWNAWNCRSEDRSIFSRGIFSNRALIGATLLVILLQLTAVYNPFLQKVLRTESLNLKDWIFIVAVSLFIIAAEEIRKMLVRRPLRGVYN